MVGKIPPNKALATALYRQPWVTKWPVPSFERAFVPMKIPNNILQNTVFKGEYKI
ncbi:MAG: hypothetical protein ABIO24_00660 [Saprospiraceae bacterium]